MTGLVFNTMQEILSKVIDPVAPLRGQEYYELRLDDCELRLSDSDFTPQPSFRVRQTRARWNEGESAIVWEAPEIWVFKTLQEAQSRYQVLRDALAESGFIDSDMDPMF